jgi:hypothetical protein
MARTTRKEADAVVNSLNEMLAARGSDARVHLEGRYDYHALDLGTAAQVARGAAQKTLTLGQLGEVVRYARAMREAIWLIDPDGPWAVAGGDNEDRS